MAFDENKRSDFRIVGTRPRRPDGIEKVTGRAQYGADMSAPGMLHGLIMRSPHAHARIKGIDTSAAEALPGVKAVVTGAEGFIGSSLVRELLKQGWDVVALHYPGADLMRLEGVPVSPRPCDILVPADLDAVIPENVSFTQRHGGDASVSRSLALGQDDLGTGAELYVIDEFDLGAIDSFATSRTR